MIKKRSRFWTIVFAMLPGAGHMFNGFMKRGVSIMGLFFVLWFAASWLGIGPLALLTPVVWFYAFFDCVNVRFQDDEDFYMQEDCYLFHIEGIRQVRLENPRLKLALGVGLIIVGVYALWNNVLMHFIYRLELLPEGIREALRQFNYAIPQIIVGVLIIWIGLELIKGKKRRTADCPPVPQTPENAVWREEADMAPHREEMAAAGGFGNGQEAERTAEAGNAGECRAAAEAGNAGGSGGTEGLGKSGNIQEEGGQG